MENIQTVKVPQGITNLTYYKGTCNFRKLLFVFYEFVQLTLRAKFKQDVNIVFVIKKPIKFNDVWVVYEGLDFQLSNELVNNVLLANDLFRNDLHGADETCTFMTVSEDKYQTIETWPNLPLPRDFPTLKSEKHKSGRR